MRRGELSNEILPRAYIVFEGLIGLLPNIKDRTAELLARKRKNWDLAASYYQLNIHTSQGIRDLYWRQRFRVDVVTFIHYNMVSPIRYKLDSRNLLFGDVVYFETPATLAHEMVYDTSILAVLDPQPENILVYGSKGRLVTPDEINLMRILA
jgi:hypothetical protein